MRISLRRAGQVWFLVLLVMVVAADAALALAPHERGRWMVGLGLGVGSGQMDLIRQTEGAEQVSTKWLPGKSAQMRFGWVFVPNRLMLSIENKQWLDEQGASEEVIPPELADEEIIKLRASVQHYSLALTWFPGRPDQVTGGLYLKGGAGWANARFNILIPTTEEEQEHGDTFKSIFVNDDSGLALFGELGYELRVWSGFAAGVAVGYNYLDLDGQVYQSAQNFLASLALNWYF